MTREEAVMTINFLKEDYEQLLTEEDAEALGMAIEALQTPPISQRRMYQLGYIQAQEDRPKGEWKVRHPKPFFLCECSVCGEGEAWMSKFCPNCGSDMRSE